MAMRQPCGVLTYTLVATICKSCATPCLGDISSITLCTALECDSTQSPLESRNENAAGPRAAGASIDGYARWGDRWRPGGDRRDEGAAPRRTRHNWPAKIRARRGNDVEFVSPGQTVLDR